MFTSCYRLHINEGRNGYTSRREIFTRALHDITIAITHCTIAILRRCFYYYSRHDVSTPMLYKI